MVYLFISSDILFNFDLPLQVTAIFKLLDLQ